MSEKSFEDCINKQRLKEAKKKIIDNSGNCLIGVINTETGDMEPLTIDEVKHNSYLSGLWKGLEMLFKELGLE